MQVEDVDATFSQAVSAGATVKIPVADMFWGDRYGALKDPLISDLHNWNIWNPFAKKDPNAKGAYSGPESGVGSAYVWEGNKNVGKGSMEIAKLTHRSEIVYKLDFISPFEAHNTATFTLEPQGDSTQVT